MRLFQPLLGSALRAAPSLLAATLMLAFPAHAQFEEQGTASFLAADQNGDQVLSLPEFRVFIRALAQAGAPQSQRIAQFGAYRLAFGRVDRNGDGVATPAELRAAEAEASR